MPRHESTLAGVEIQPDRRRLLALLGGVLAELAGGTALRAAAGVAPGPLRPPGAQDEASFLAACIRCGRCALACPPEHDVLRIADLDAGPRAGAPYVVARERPCRLCSGLDAPRCIEACPTAALAPVADLREIRMGIARVDPAICWAFHGTMCRSCTHACPWPNEAIRLDARLRPVVTDECIGCGLCEHACPTDPAAIVIEPFGKRAS